jgi:hypothetical protein
MAAQPFIVKKKFVVIAEEVTRGTMITAFTSEHRNVRVYGIEVEPELDMHMREYNTGRHSQASAIPGKFSGTLKLKHDFAIPLDLSENPPAHSLLKACGQGFDPLWDADEYFWRYSPQHVLDTGVTLTMVVVYVSAEGDAIACALKGCMGNCVISSDGIGGKPVMDFTFKGGCVGIGTWETMVPGVDIPEEDYTPAAPCTTFKGASSTHDGVLAYFGKFSFDFGNQVETLDVCKDGEVSGVEAAYIADRKPKLSWDTLARLHADDPTTQRWQDGEEFETIIPTNHADVEFESVATSAFMRLRFQRTQIMTQKTGDMKGALSWDRNNEVHEVEGDDAHFFDIVGIVAPTALTYSNNGPVSYASGGAITPNTASFTGTQSGETYSVSPALPAGLTLNTSTGTISGTPTTPTAAANYVVTVENAAGEATRTLNITIT